ncbi:DUF1707 SHOCT-like domain-containing protein [Actinomadura alba]|uniref:DUF1707 domain-containing protein n=1 Tax=Actinomadura alba TaxID=406431 RepID=A0ABR7LLM1_9ACTN|nr:DUF1707 domain-containing protein [Actinomadura alba]MBC6465766.1 DUF1707 domain-containing protein [Actinomadura alba]
MTGEMSPMGRGDEVASPDDVRASHEDRDRVVELLRVAAGDGRLTADELDERLEKALTARTHGELRVLTRDLPAARDLIAGASAPQPRESVRIDCHSGSTKRDGRWLVPQRIHVHLSSGSVTLDFTEAVITQPSLQIEVDMRSGMLTLVTKPGVMVDADDVAVRSGSVKVRAPWDRDIPTTLRIHVSGKVASGSISARPPRRTFWQWLRRRPRPYALAPP